MNAPLIAFYEDFSHLLGRDCKGETIIIAGMMLHPSSYRIFGEGEYSQRRPPPLPSLFMNTSAAIADA
jgi:hypothetical protein